VAQQGEDDMLVRQVKAVLARQLELYNAAVEKIEKIG
jgi:hypothetical protein